MYKNNLTYEKSGLFFTYSGKLKTKKQGSCEEQNKLSEEQLKQYKTIYFSATVLFFCRKVRKPARYKTAQKALPRLTPRGLALCSLKPCPNKAQEMPLWLRNPGKASPFYEKRIRELAETAHKSDSSRF